MYQYIYSKSSNFFRLAAATSDKSSIEIGKSFEYNEKIYFYNELQRKDVYMNREFNENKPTYVLAIYGEDETVDAIIIIWAMNLAQVSLYQSSMLVVLSRLVEKTMASALEYENLHFENAYIEETRVLKMDAFMEKVRVFASGEENGLMSYTILRLSTKGNGTNATFLKEAESLVRDTDYVGCDMKYVYLLLSS